MIALHSVFSCLSYTYIDSKKIAEQVGETSSQSVVVAVDRYFVILINDHHCILLF